MLAAIPAEMEDIDKIKDVGDGGEPDSKTTALCKKKLKALESNQFDIKKCVSSSFEEREFYIQQMGGCLKKLPFIQNLKICRKN